MDTRPRIPRTGKPDRSELRFEGTGRRGVVGLAAVVVVAAVALGAVLWLRPDSREAAPAPSRVSPATATKTVTKEVTPPAYTTSSRVSAQVLFDGSRCSYSGPAELKANTLVTFEYTASVKHSQLIVWLVQPETTYEEVAQAMARWDPTGPLNGYLSSVSSPSGAMHQSLALMVGRFPWTMAAETELRAVSCSLDRGPFGRTLFPATMLRVTKG